MEVKVGMAKVLDRPFGVASVVDLARASLAAELPHGRRRGEPNSFKPWELVQAWRQRRADRAELRTLDARLLEDAGLDQQEARREAYRPFWEPLRLHRRDRR
jgi:uncharacterized protein YjiS (DUF1127 family)